MKIHELSVKRPVAVSMIVLICVIIGLYSVSMLSIESMPEMDLSMAIVSTTYTGTGSEEIENLVTKKIENAISSVEGVDTITSSSSEGSSLVMVQFKSGTDMDDATSDMRSGIEMIKPTLPTDCNDPLIIQLDTSMMPVAMMSMSYEGYDLVQTKKFVEDTVEKSIESVSGVASINIMGANDRIIDIKIDPTKMAGYGVDISSVIAAVTTQNNNIPSGTITSSNKEVNIRTIGKFDSLRDIENVTIHTPKGQIIHVRDIADVVDTFSDDSSYARVDGVSAISLAITSESDANTVDVVNAVMDELDSIRAQNPKFSYNAIYESASYIENSVSSVAQSAVTGGILAVIVLLLFLGSIKTSLVIGVSMPISIITTFIGMYFSGMTLNVVSLGGLSLGVGMLVDNAVVVIENIFRRRDDLGEEPKTAATVGTGEVIAPVIASVLTTCIVYVPVLFINNMVAVMFKQLAFSIIFSQCASLIVTFLIIPMLSARIDSTKPKKGSKLYKLIAPFEKLLSKLYVIYEKALRYVLSHRKKFVLGVIGVFALAMVVLFNLGMTLMPESDEGSVSVSISLPQGAPLERTDAITREAEEKIKEHQDVESIFATVGSGGGFSMSSGTNSSSITVNLSDKRSKTTNEISQEIRELLSNIAGATIEVSSSNTSMGMSSDSVDWNFSANDEDALYTYVEQLEEVLKDIEGVSETSTSIDDKITEARIVIDSDKAANYGMTGSQAATLVRYATSGAKASKYTEGGLEYDITVSYPDNYLQSYNDLKAFQIKAPTGQWISLSDIADIKLEQGSVTLKRVNQQRVVTLSAKIFGSDMSTVNKNFEKAISSITPPDGISRETGGSLEMMMDAMTSLVFAIFLGIILMYLVMAAQFEDMKQPMIILTTLPLCMIGVVLSLILNGGTLSVVGCIGILMLIGIVVNNAIVLIDFINVSRRENPQASRTELVVNAGKTRMRPILMTSLTSILGFMPMAYATTEGSEMMAPLGQVLVGGLTVGTFLTLLVIPVVYTIFDDRSKKAKEKRAAKKAANKTAISM